MLLRIPFVFVTLVRFVLGWLWSLGLASVFCACCLVIDPRRLWCWLRTPWARGTLSVVGVRLNVTGAERLRGPAVFIANHQSLIDVVIVPAVVPRETLFVAKRGLRYIPLWGWAFAAGGALLIDRKNARAAFCALREGTRILPHSWSLAVFPEGTRSRTGRIGRFKRGAFVLAREGQRDVVPIGLAGAEQIIGPDGWLVRGGTVHVHVGAPLRAADWADRPLRDFIAAGEQAVAAAVATAQGATGVVALDAKPDVRSA